jgi:DNA-directed RNA polymerase specialized sigma24 family protein
MESDFQRLIAAIRAGDRQTADELVRKIEPYLRAAIHLRLTDSKLRRSLDTVDICQSVLLALFARGSLGWTGQETDEHIRRKIVKMAANKLVTKARREKWNLGPLPEGYEIVDLVPSPSQVVADRELKTAIWNHLTEAERWLFEQNKLQGRTWKEIAEDVDGLPPALRGSDQDSLRMRLRRAVLRVREELQHDGARHSQPIAEDRACERAGLYGMAR